MVRADAVRAVLIFCLLGLSSLGGAVLAASPNDALPYKPERRVGLRAEPDFLSPPAHAARGADGIRSAELSWSKIEIADRDGAGGDFQPVLKKH